MMLKFFLVVSLLFITPLMAQAGSLFPPENMLSTPNSQCPNGTVLKWTGDSVICSDPSPGVSVAQCPATQVMIGVNKGVPICRAEASAGSVTVPSCPSGQYLAGITSGTAVCRKDETSSTATLNVQACPSGQVMTGIISGTAICTTPTARTGGIYARIYNGGCMANPLTGGCSCPSGYSASRVMDFTVACGATPLYAGTCGTYHDFGGMKQGWSIYQCTK